MVIDYKFNEDKLFEEIVNYIDATYSQHYSFNKFQATEFIIDSGYGRGFTVGNILKYAQRLGKKGGPETERKDLMKIIHYAILALYVHDVERKDVSDAVDAANADVEAELNRRNLLAELERNGGNAIPYSSEEEKKALRFSSSTSLSSSIITPDEEYFMENNQYGGGGAAGGSANTLVDMNKSRYNLPDTTKLEYSYRPDPTTASGYSGSWVKSETAKGN